MLNAGRLAAAVDNNAAWCELVCRARGIPTTRRETLWLALEPSPPLYPDVVTLSPQASAEEVAGAAPSSVKDSFAVLDLEPYGYRVLFEARWLHRSPPAVRPTRWSVAASEADLRAWAQAAGGAVDIPAAVLRERSVRALLAGSSGAIANRTGEVVGISNVFGEALEDPDTWSELAAAVAAAFPSLAIVGYEHGGAVEAALASGFEDLGPLRVWVRRA